MRAIMLARSSAIPSRFLTARVASLRPSRRLPLRTPLVKTSASIRQFSVFKMSVFPTPSSDPPKNEMVYFPNMTTALPSQSAEFRRVLWTGLYSQLVLMTVPVGGDIGEEVCRPLIRSKRNTALTSPRFTLWTKSLPSRPGQDSLKLQVKSRMSRLETWSLFQPARNISS